MDVASGGLSDEQRSKGDFAKGGIVNPREWRILDAGPGDGCYIPLSRPHHSTALLKQVAERMGFKQHRGGENGDEA